jgi:pyridoxamine 5'-phosphate oxidase
MYMIFREKENISTLDGVLDSSWKLLHEGVRNFRNPFHHSMLTTIDDNKPQVRTVILREFSEKDRTLICHCDARGSKVLQIRDNPNVSWLFYDPKKWLQMRLSGTASVHTDDNTAESQWEKVRLPHRINYCAEIPPGSPTGKPTSGLSDFLQVKAPKLFDSSVGRKNFAAIVCQFDEMDWLLLKLTGHIRAIFHWKDNRMDASWVIP